MAEIQFQAGPNKIGRRPSPRVKTGCQTCKIRRVKCDEKRPSCLRCTGIGRKCEYSKSKQEYQVQVFNSQAPTLQHAMPTLFGVGENVHFLEFYHHCAAPSLSSPDSFDDEFWSCISLQMAQSEPAVRHALIAIGYLHREEGGSLKDARLAVLDDRRTLLLHYNKSVRHLVTRMKEPSYSPEIGLVACILYACIELLRADYFTASMHFRNGLKIITELRRKRRIDSPTELPVASEDILAHTNMVEDKLVPLYIRAMTSTLIFGTRVERDFPILCPCPESLSHFSSFRSAQLSYFSLRNAAVLFVRRMMTHSLKLIAPTTEDLQEQAQLLQCHTAWFRSLTTLEKAAKTPSPAETVRSSALKVSYYSTLIGVSCATDIAQMAFDAHLPSFKAIVHHAHIVLDSMNLAAPGARKQARAEAAHFTFEIALIPPLYITAMKCRCPATRREAIALLARNPPREGPWDAEQHVLVLNRVVQIEEAVVDSRGWPAEELRLFICVIDASMDGNGGFWADLLPARLVGSWRARQTGREARGTSEWFELGKEKGRMGDYDREKGYLVQRRDKVVGSAEPL
ncbi:hypothetical protein P154DRAFT_616806 [Amniculicola lignicola CBS 123094]|uniref:Zn(2)-C6 fungal-type domain-containing protein n=1 Tax=Amniculicola lignicola CBS 123094 TaxID=1392246 RepID=A0A6A5WZX9_9PLEO|nr:hypothetical protein P154DRAFT_616806 [Amniculicola lignicola CBS 123094]